MKIADYIGHTISLRYHADDLLEVIEASPECEVILDFEGIEFVSRCFAQEFLQRVANCNKSVKMVNCCKDVTTMFYIVEHPRPKKKVN